MKSRWAAYWGYGGPPAWHRLCLCGTRSCGACGSPCWGLTETWGVGGRPSEGETAQLGLQWALAVEDRCSGWREQHVEGTACGGNSVWRLRGLTGGPRAVPCGCMSVLHLLERDQQFAFSVWLQRDVILSTHLTSEADTAVLKSLPCVTCGKPGARSLHSCWRASYFRC